MKYNLDILLNLTMDTLTSIFDIESNTNEKVDKFLIELQNIDLTTKLNQNPFSNPSKNYDTFINILTNIKQRLLPKKGLNLTKRNIKNLSG